MNDTDILSEFISDEEYNLAVTRKQINDSRKEEYTNTKSETAKGHRSRVKERFMQSGLTGFAQHEVLELLLFYTIPQRDTKQIAHELINRFGSIAGVLDADVEELVKVKNITENSAVLFRLIPMITDLYYSQKSDGVCYDNSELISEMFRSKFLARKTEAFMIACFDNDLKLLEVSEISSGSASFTSVDIRKMAETALGCKSSMAAVAHNHPGCSSKPSDEDVVLTRRIMRIFREIGITLMDHIIIGANDTYSMKDNGDISALD